jgi:nitroreductase/NAD-dependent dihydropyrimidine dehydrogenase PreA subunit
MIAKECALMELLQVNRELCTKCGICAAICPNGLIGIGAEGPQEQMIENCLACGHCVAACPQGALDNRKAPLADQAQLPQYPVIDSQTAARFLRGRRSIRNYQKKQISREKLLELLEIARFAPSGCNSQGLSYLVVQNPAVLKEITARTIEWLDGQVKAGVPWAAGFAGVVAIYRDNGYDVILREAPSLIIATAPQEMGMMAHENARFALEYVELYATSLGLGTCWAGFVELAAGSNYQPLLAALRLPEGTAFAGAMMAGYPQYTFKRLVDRNPLQVSWV